LLQVTHGKVLAVSSDMLVSRHALFPPGRSVSAWHKTLAVNLSDLAAMGAYPRWATLAISLPRADESWLEQFSAGFFALANRYGVDLIEGTPRAGRSIFA